MEHILKSQQNSFHEQAMTPDNAKWNNAIQRQASLEQRNNDIRTEFGRDYTRILHSLGYRRLKHKTQVFFSPENDHICTRIEHVNHVESVSFTIANFLGLNTELTKAISISHDIGHAPFGHLGETILKSIAEKELNTSFWHEKNGLHFVDDVEALLDSNNNYTNLNLTYAVRDGIISHCGEVNQNALNPRDQAINLSEYKSVNQFNPFTWEGCVVKYADKISYLGRDIEDALKLKLINVNDVLPLLRYVKKTFNTNINVINTTSLMHIFIIDLCKNSSPVKGLCFSDEVFHLMKAVMAFNYEKIYKHSRLEPYRHYANELLNAIYSLLLKGYDGLNTREQLVKIGLYYPELFNEFTDWIKLRWDLGGAEKRNSLHVVYNVSSGENEYKKAVIDYIAGMTDNYAKRMYNTVCSFK